MRWHKEVALMRRRYRVELATHSHGVYPWRSLAPIGLAGEIDCHCARGIGTMRKHRPGVCEKRNCFCKMRDDPKRSDMRLQALAAIED